MQSTQYTGGSLTAPGAYSSPSSSSGLGAGASVTGSGGMRPRPSIHFHELRHHNGEFQFPKTFRKRKRGSPPSSDDEEQHHSHHYGTIYDHYPIHSQPHSYHDFPPQLHVQLPQRLLQPPRSPESPIKSRSPSTDDSESDHKVKRPRRTSYLERGIGEMSLHSQSAAISEDPQSNPAPYNPYNPYHLYNSYAATSPVLSSTTSQSGTSYGEYRYLVDNEGRTDKSYLVSEPELLAIDEDFMPREEHHGDDDDFQLGPAIQEIQEIGGTQRHGTAVIRPKTEYEHSYPKRRKKGSTSWYEPEKDRIIITSLDDSDSEEENQTTLTPQDQYQYQFKHDRDQDGDIDLDQDQSQTQEPLTIWDEKEGRYKPFQPLEISPALLSTLGRLAIPRPTIPLTNEEKDCMALVAYRPPPFSPTPAAAVTNNDANNGNNGSARLPDEVEEWSSPKKTTYSFSPVVTDAGGAAYHDKNGNQSYGAYGAYGAYDYDGRPRNSWETSEDAMDVDTA